MSITPSQRIQAYQGMDEKFQLLYSSENTSKFYSAMLAKFNISHEKEGLCIDLVGDVILGFYKITDLPRLFQQKLEMSADDSQRMTSQLIEFLGPVVKREEEEAKRKKEELGKLADTFAKPEEIVKKETGGVEESQAEGVAPIRTMAQDMSRVHGYGAYREELEKEEQPIKSSQDDLLGKKGDGDN